MSDFLFQGARFSVMRIPRVVAKCPECGGHLYVQGTEWESDSRKPTEFGVEVECENEPDLDDPDFWEKCHRHWQGEWMPVLDHVTRWARRFIRVVPREAVRV